MQYLKISFARCMSEFVQGRRNTVGIQNAMKHTVGSLKVVIPTGLAAQKPSMERRKRRRKRRLANILQELG